MHIRKKACEIASRLTTFYKSKWGKADSQNDTAVMQASEDDKAMGQSPLIENQDDDMQESRDMGNGKSEPEKIDAGKTTLIQKILDLLKPGASSSPMADKSLEELQQKIAKLELEVETLKMLSWCAIAIAAAAVVISFF